ncbi:MAG: hypothetical protein GEU99_23080 [Luteitalea sp.]|nr:hypothetical protein [Luteitalea sp.]
MQAVMSRRPVAVLDGPPYSMAASTTRHTTSGPPRHRGLVRRLIRGLMIFATLVLVADAIFGQKGVLERVRVRRQYEQLKASVDALKQQNRSLREEARRLREDPSAIEAIARRELGLVKPGELLFIVKDVPAPPASGQSPSSRPGGRGRGEDASEPQPEGRGSPEP